MNSSEQFLCLYVIIAFDMVPDQSVALETLINIGCSRVLTSGARPTAVEGLHSIKNLVQQV